MTDQHSSPMSETYPEPTAAMLCGDLLFDAIWQAIKGWDISRHNNGLYSGPTGNDARHIYDAVSPITQRSSAATVQRDNDIGILLSALRMLEEAVGESFDDDGGDVAQIEADYRSRVGQPQERGERS